MKYLTAVLALAWAVAPSSSWSKDDPTHSSQAGSRTYAQNYKDMVLADCIATAYKSEPEAAQDAGSSASALMVWTYFDLEQAPQAGRTLVDQSLARDYHNPLVESERKGVRFELLKCLDLYHSKELDSQVRQLVIKPQHTYRQDNPPRSKKD
ncbi:MAG: type VI secretion system amidase immunity protein Tai4 [Pseudomonas sp.]|uniref:type VI secretion system amidase immunity protein Tai4 n=1 Tax=Pseudomonas sp. TaxID=306 RepID=UPI003D0DB453